MSTNPAPAPKFEFITERVEQCMVVHCRGKLTFEHATLFRDKVRAMMSNEKRIVLDLKEVPMMDSSGLGALVTVYVSGRSHGCKVELASVSPALRQLFSVTNLLSLFEKVGQYDCRLP
jgi:stage II sporulation protein AA (anti-sigma F factor antagonist)